MIEKELEKETTEIIAELTKPKALQHLTARLVALSRRGIHKYLYEHPELVDDVKTENVVDLIMESIGSAIEVIMEYRVEYYEDRQYTFHPKQPHKEPRPVQVKSGDSNRASDDFHNDTSNANVDVQDQPTTAGRINDNTSGDNRRTGSVPKPSRKPKQSERPKCGKPNRKPESE